VDRLSSVDLATALAEIETSPWGEWSHGKPLSPGKLARLLKPFEVSPETVRLGDKTPRGYLVEQFQEAFRRYLRAETSSSPYNTPQSATLQQTAGSPSVFNDLASDSEDSSKCNNDNDVAAQKREKLTENVVCCAVALSNPPTGTGMRGI
jgi:hypothetical protein